MEAASIYHQKSDINISRTVYDETFFIATSWKESANTEQYLRTVCTKLAKCLCSGNGLYSLLIRLAPIVRWLPKYNVKEDLLADITGGVTVGVMHIPQGTGLCFFVLRLA